MAYRITYESPGVEANKTKRLFLVDAEADLANLPSDTAPGSVAHTCGYAAVWEKGINGVWQAADKELMYRFGTDNGLPYIEDI
jgi:hypothetical protein